MSPLAHRCPSGFLFVLVDSACGCCRPFDLLDAGRLRGSVLGSLFPSVVSVGYDIRFFIVSTHQSSSLAPHSLECGLAPSPIIFVRASLISHRPAAPLQDAVDDSEVPVQARLVSHNLPWKNLPSPNHQNQSLSHCVRSWSFLLSPLGLGTSGVATMSLSAVSLYRCPSVLGLIVLTVIAGQPSSRTTMCSLHLSLYATQVASGNLGSNAHYFTACCSPLSSANTCSPNSCTLPWELSCRTL